MLYKENFLNKNLLIISQGKDKIYTYEMRFSKTNFLHLTGVKLLEIKGFDNAFIKEYESINYWRLF